MPKRGTTLAKYIRLDPYSGASGDMLLGALVDLGVDPQQLRSMLEKLPLEGWKLGFQETKVGGLRAVRALVEVPHEHVHRHLSDIRDIAGDSGLPANVIRGGLQAFTALAEAEAAAHGTEVEKVHFHEVGAMDAILDIFGAFCCLSLLGVSKVYCSPVHIGSGTVECAHGVMPVPAPATARLLEGVPVVPTDEPGEMVTPTGAALLRSVVDDWDSLGAPGKIRASGFGAGSRDLQRANLLRAVMVETEERGLEPEGSCLEIRTVVDDMDQRLFPVVVKEVMAAGAVDCYACHTTGRKGRPGLEITVIAPPGSRADVLSALFGASTTIGARVQEVPRVELDRDTVRVAVAGGAVDVKLARLDGRVVSAEPEMECCRQLAGETGLPVKVILAAARGQAGKLYGKTAEEKD